MPRQREDLTGKRFGRLIVTGYDRTDSHGETWWLCKCDCGNPSPVSVRRQSLRQSHTTSCGCKQHELKVDLTGQKFNRLTVIAFEGRNHLHKASWRCRCDCGMEIVVDGYNLTSGHTKSCGCLNIESIQSRSITHGHSRTGEGIYPVWKSMRARCNNPNSHAYKNYGGRGISVCDEWDTNFQSFYDWSMNNGYNPELTIDRIDNDGNYGPDNCRWTTPKEQANNKRTCRYITYANETHTISEWSKIFEVPYSALLARINNNNMRDFEEYFGNKE